MTAPSLKTIALAGGVGGAKLAHGLAQCLPADDLTVIVNVGDDFDHLGLRICPDLDTVCYTLAGIANPETGWGRAEESWHTFEEIKALGGPGWFQLGDRDLATHLERTHRLAAGQPLSSITREFCKAWGIQLTVLPATDNFTPTWVYTDHEILPFQEYFVHRQCQPRVTGFRFEGAERARPAPGVIEAINTADVIIICPSNPWVSIDPILAIPGIREAIKAEKGEAKTSKGKVREKPVLAVSPIIGGKTVKGPAAKMYAELGIKPTALAVASHYRGLLTDFVLDTQDADQVDAIQAMGIRTLATNTLMVSPDERRRLAQEALEFVIGNRLGKRGEKREYRPT